MDNEAIIKEAIKQHKGKRVSVGTCVASESNPFVYRLIRYEGDDAICDQDDGVEKVFPADEIFSFDAVKATAVAIVRRSIVESIAAAN